MCIIYEILSHIRDEMSWFLIYVSLYVLSEFYLHSVKNHYERISECQHKLIFSFFTVNQQQFLRSQTIWIVWKKKPRIECELQWKHVYLAMTYFRRENFSLSLALSISQFTVTVSSWTDCHILLCLSFFLTIVLVVVQEFPSMRVSLLL